MKIAIDVSPLTSGHKVRGVGFYLRHLKDALANNFPSEQFYFFEKNQPIPMDVDLVHYPYFDPFFLTLPFFSKRKTVVTVHDLTPLVLPELFPAGLKGNIKWLLQRNSLRKVQAIITDSQSSKEDIARIIGYNKKNIHVAYLAAGEEFKQIPNPCLPAGRSKSQIQSIKKKYNLPDRFALYVGDVTPNKNLPNLVKAALRAEIPLVMVGKALTDNNIPKNPWTKDLEEVQSLAYHNKLIIRLGFVQQSDLVMLYNCASVFVMPSLYEGFGLPILEAFSCGCPVITSTRGSLSEVAQNAAYIVDPLSIDDISKGIQKIAGNSLLAKKLTEKGLAQAKKFSWKITAEKTMQVYKNILQ